jgi:hypothetical protein
MPSFQVLNARHQPTEQLIRFDTGRKHHRDIVREAILDSSRNVYLFGSRGSGKTFFQKTQAYYFGQLDKEALPLFVPCDIRWGFDRHDSTDFALHVLNTLFLEWWHKAYERPKSDLLRLGMMGNHSVLNDLRSEQKRFVELYTIVNAKQVDIERRQSSLFGAAAVAKAENKRDEAQAVSRGGLLSSEVSAILSDLAEIISKAMIRRIIVHLDEVELIGSNRGSNFYSTCLELFNPVGVQFVVTGTPTIASDQESVLTSFETTVEIEGFETVDELKSMITKYSGENPCAIEDDAIDVLYEFFGGHPRSSLAVCADVSETAGREKTNVTPRLMTKACLFQQKRLEEAKKLHEEMVNKAMQRPHEHAGR